MTERLIVRVALRGEPEDAAARGDRGSLSKPGRPLKRLWIVGGAVVVGLSVVVAAALMIGLPGGRSIERGVTGAEARTEDSGSPESGGDRPTDTGGLPDEPAVRPTFERKDVPVKPAIRPSTADTGVESVAKRSVRPPVAARKPVERPESAVSRDRVAPDRSAMAEDAAAEYAAETVTGAGSPEETEARSAVSEITDPRVLRAQLSAGVNGKEPTARLQPPVQVTGRGGRTIYYFSEVRDFDGQTLFHRWEWEGRVVASVPVKVRGQRWRFYSRKTITPRMTGRWRVVLTESTGKVLAGSEFLVR